MPPLSQLATTLLALLFKLLILSLIVPLLVISNFLFISPALRLAFYWQPFLYASAALIGFCALIAWRRHDWGSLAIGFAVVATAGVIYLHQPSMPGKGAEWVLTALSAPAAISFLYRNRITEPMLIFSALIVLGYAFTDILYPAALLLWAHFAADYPLGLKNLWTTLESLNGLLGVAPAALLYWLGKQGYSPWLDRAREIWRRHRNRNLAPSRG